MKLFNSFGYAAAAAISAICFISCASGSDEGFALAEPFSDGMIIAKDKPFHVFGEGSGRIFVKVTGEKDGATEFLAAGAARATDGKWDARIPAIEAGGPYTLTVSSKSGEIVVNDVYFGNVIMVAGQSNMQYKLHESSTPEEEWTGDPLLRSYSLPRMEEGEPFSPEDGWVKCTETNAGDWSAIGYHVGKLIREKTGEPTAIINCYQGASDIETWIPKEISSRPEYTLPDELTHIDHRWGYEWNFPGVLYDFALSRIFPYTLSQVVWYQGESNTGKGEYKIYPAMARELVTSWRKAFMDPKLPFIMIQIADYDHRQDEAWKNLQVSQMIIPSIVEGVTVVPCADVCESDNIHPKTKSVLAARIADTILGE